MSNTEIIDLNFHPLSNADLHTIADEFSKQCQEATQSKASSLAMYQSYLTRRQPNASEPVLAVDIGGSKVRLGIFSIMDGKAMTMPGTGIDEQLFRGTTTTLTEYTDYLAGFIANYLESQPVKPKKIGVAFSYPAKIIKNGNMLDADRSGLDSEWGKSFTVNNSALNVTAFMRDKLAEKGMSWENWVTVNDVISLLVAEPEANVSLVVGTGYNIGINHNNALYNSEAGYFNCKLMETHEAKPTVLYFRSLQGYLVEQGIDPLNSSALKDKSEVQISGGYLYKLLNNTLYILGENDCRLLKAIEQLESKSLTLFLTKEFDEFEQLSGVRVPNSKRIRLERIARQLFERSTQLVAAEVAGAIKFASAVENNLVIAATGTTLERLPGFKSGVETLVAELLSVPAVEIRIQSSALPGAAIAAVML